MMIEIQEETLKDILPEIKPLLVKHWEEVAIFQETVKLDPDYEKYLEIERLGFIHVVTVRNHNALIGYCVTLISPNLHYRQTKFATNDVVFILPEYRGWSIAKRLLKYVEYRLVERGIEVLNYHVKVDHDFSPLLIRMGYSITEKNCTKYLGGR